MQQKHERYGFFTTISMIIGIVIGSGIFFKAPNILIATSGNVFLGVLVFVFASIAIIFGSLTLAELAFRSTGNGGILSYAKESYGNNISGVLGWFLSFVYFPTIRSVVAWVSIIYLKALFDLKTSFEVEILLTLLLVIFITIGNIISAKGSGIFQIFATIIKLIPLFVVAIIGFFFPNTGFENEAMTNLSYTTITSNVFIGFLVALGPVSFSFDGWTVSTTIAKEIKNKRRTLPLALTFAPIFILIVYVIFFIGVTNLMEPESIMNHGSDYIYIILQKLFGNVGAKLLLVTIVISMIGTTNGVTLGDSRTLAYLGDEDLMFFSGFLKKRTKSKSIPVNGLIFSSIVTIVWLFIHYLTVKFNLLVNSDISEIAISTLYFLLIGLYTYVIKLKIKGEITSFFKGYIFPILAIIGSIIIFTGSMQNKYFIFYFAFSFVVLIASYVYLRLKKTKTNL